MAKYFNRVKNKEVTANLGLLVSFFVEIDSNCTVLTLQLDLLLLIELNFGINFSDAYVYLNSVKPMRCEVPVTNIGPIQAQLLIKKLQKVLNSSMKTINSVLSNGLLLPKIEVPYFFFEDSYFKPFPGFIEWDATIVLYSLI